MPTNNIIPELEMTKAELAILWDYNVSLSESYVKVSHGETCRICDNNYLMSYISPYLAASVPSDKIIELLVERERAGDVDEITNIVSSLTVEEIDLHKNHFSIYVAGDRDVKSLAVKYQSVVDSDLVQNIDVKKVLESNIRSLEAQRLMLEQAGQIGTKEYTAIVAQLFKFVELKMKANKDIAADGTTNLNLSDFIKIESPNDTTRTNRTKREDSEAEKVDKQ